MLRIICAVYDSAANAYGQPFFVPAVGLATRSFIDEVNREAPDNTVYVHPDDYTLFRIGAFDDETGQLVPEKPTSLLRGKDAKRSE